MISIHDHRLLAYHVDCEARQITLRTIFQDEEPHEKAQITFTGVLAYHFEGDAFGTILFDITAVPPAEIVGQYAELFARLKNYGWPGPTYQTPEELNQRLEGSGVTGYLIYSSCGMDGFVLAKRMEIRAAAAAPKSTRC
ncbi:MAG: hypothetical protein ACK47B_10195 [Armatimonadota bacterium]